MSPKTARIKKLKRKVEAHDQNFTAIQSSVTEIDSKIDVQGKKTAFHFDRFEEMLSHIHGMIVAGITQATETTTAALMTDDMLDEHQYEEGAYDPIQRSHDWNETWSKDQAHCGFVATQHDEYAEQLRKEAAAPGKVYDYYAVAYGRDPSPPPIQYPYDSL